MKRIRLSLLQEISRQRNQFLRAFFGRRISSDESGSAFPLNCSALFGALNSQVVGSSNTMSLKLRGPIAVATGFGIASLRSLKSLFDEPSRVPSTSFPDTPSIVVLLVKEAMPTPIATAIGPLIFGDIVLDDKRRPMPNNSRRRRTPTFTGRNPLAKKSSKKLFSLPASGGWTLSRTEIHSKHNC